MAYKKLKLWFDAILARSIAEKIVAEYPEFPAASFVQEVDKKLENLELKARIAVFAQELKRTLPDEYPEAVAILHRILGPENEKETGMFTEGYWIMPIAFFVEEYGLDHFAVSMNLIEAITKRNTGEYCIRPFILQYPKKTLKVMKTWAKSPNKHLRRLASEGLRIRLPWAKKIDLFVADFSPVLQILELLKDDSSKYVQKSVANSFNDWLKEDRESAMRILEKWAKTAGPERKWIVKHALRNELKKEKVEAMKIVKGMV